MRYLFLLALASPLLPYRAAAAQESSQELMPGLDSGAFARLQARVNAQDRVRIRTRSGEWVIITQPYLTANQLETPATSPVDLRYVAVMQVRGSSAGTGAMVGAGIGFVPGFVAGVALAGLCVSFYFECSEPDTGERLSAGFRVGAVGAAIGALLGAAIGAPIHWKTVYRAEGAPARSARLLLTPRSQGGFILGASVRF